MYLYMFVLKIPTETMVTYAFEYMGVSENSLDFWVPYFQTNPYTAQSDTFFVARRLWQVLRTIFSDLVRQVSGEVGSEKSINPSSCIAGWYGLVWFNGSKCGLTWFNGD